jgi:mannosyltransferase OCH1-like enzyme
VQKNNSEITMIPKIIYQTWYKKELPEQIKKTVNKMLEINSNYEYYFYDDNDIENFILKNFNNDIFSAYKLLNIGAAKADFWRYLVLYKTGGIYLDVDSIIYGQLDTLIHDDCAIISREKNYGKFVQWCLIYPPNHPILKICIDKCIFNIINNTTNDIIELTGPIVYTQSINEYFNDNNLYSKEDFQINLLKEKTKTKIHLFDYEGYAYFRNPFSDSLYKDRPHWRSEQAVKKIVN